ncbi:DNA (cytosine-5)-methyltransferase DRM2-like [Trifolium medium]|uniref:DNA (Cytosine-5)-methyltransferase DRM2-like n=1 Tax=Trifolium medium TaxID=97028 RepID=A0A392MSB3_9FABA|nr:DNA (cytosine-5)-methyltransferase DRM2-like [Trifolium medium]
MENDRNKRPKYEYDNSNSSLDPYWVEEKVDTVVATMSRRDQSNPSRRLSIVAAKPPFFLFGNVSNIAYESVTLRKQLPHSSKATSDYQGCNTVVKEMVSALGFKEAVEL